MKKIIQKINDIEPAGNSSIEDNLSREERDALCELQIESNIVIREADKRGALVVMNKDFMNKN